jgi:hypothetical protein
MLMDQRTVRSTVIIEQSTENTRSHGTDVEMAAHSVSSSGYSGGCWSARRARTHPIQSALVTMRSVAASSSHGSRHSPATHSAATSAPAGAWRRSDGLCRGASRVSGASRT